MTQAELNALRERVKGQALDVSPEQVWGAVRNAEESVRTLKWSRIPADAMAFYRPFHVPPTDQWGIYLLVGELLRYHDRLVGVNKDLRLFSAETLMHLILFEVFNHEFFHHLVESAATTIELLLASQGTPRPVYLPHRRFEYDNRFEHPHAPLEEALANAYAYNSLTFISRIKAGFKTASVKAYQKAVEAHWRQEPEGYCYAGFYTGGDYVAGGSRLLAQMMGNPAAADDVPLSVVAKHVMPNGFTALQAKPDIPTWLVGNPLELEIFYSLVPAPNEAYSQLFWPYDTSSIDKIIEQRLAEEKAKRAAKKAAQSVASRKR
jgi:hypothetical protein